MNQKNNLLVGAIIAIVVVMSYDVGVDGDQIIDFQTGNLTQEEILEMYNEPEK